MINFFYHKRNSLYLLCFWCQVSFLIFSQNSRYFFIFLFFFFVLDYIFKEILYVWFSFRYFFFLKVTVSEKNFYYACKINILTKEIIENTIGFVFSVCLLYLKKMRFLFWPWGRRVMHNRTEKLQHYYGYLCLLYVRTSFVFAFFTSYCLFLQKQLIFCFIIVYGLLTKF